MHRSGLVNFEIFLIQSALIWVDNLQPNPTQDNFKNQPNFTHKDWIRLS